MIDFIKTFIEITAYASLAIFLICLIVTTIDP